MAIGVREATDNGLPQGSAALTNFLRRLADELAHAPDLESVQELGEDMMQMLRDRRAGSSFQRGQLVDQTVLDDREINRWTREPMTTNAHCDSCCGHYCDGLEVLDE
jgi:phage terminase large subunit-like protein